MGSTDWPWVDGCARCAGLAADPQPGLFTWQEMAGRHFEQDHPPVVSGVPPIYGPPQRGTRIIDPLKATVPEAVARLHDYLTPHPELGTDVTDAGDCLACTLILKAAVRAAAPDSDDDPDTPELLRAEIGAAVKDYRTVWPEPHALSPNLSLAVRALALLPAERHDQRKCGCEGIHRPYTDDGVTYCGWDRHEGCGEVWPCSHVQAQRAGA